MGRKKLPKTLIRELLPLKPRFYKQFMAMLTKVAELTNVKQMREANGDSRFKLGVKRIVSNVVCDYIFDDEIFDQPEVSKWYKENTNSWFEQAVRGKISSSTYCPPNLRKLIILSIEHVSHILKESENP